MISKFVCTACERKENEHGVYYAVTLESVEPYQVMAFRKAAITEGSLCLAGVDKTGRVYDVLPIEN